MTVGNFHTCIFLLTKFIPRDIKITEAEKWPFPKQEPLFSRSKLRFLLDLMQNAVWIASAGNRQYLENPIVASYSDQPYGAIADLALWLAARLLSPDPFVRAGWPCLAS